VTASTGARVKKHGNTAEKNFRRVHYQEKWKPASGPKKMRLCNRPEHVRFPSELNAL